MIRMPLTVTYRDGTSREVVATQYAMGQYAAWCMKQGMPMPAADGKPDLGALLQLRFMAYAELKRDATGPFPQFPTWDDTVDEVAAPEGETATVPPTGPATSAG